MEEFFTPKESTPKTKTESAGGGDPPRKTLVGDATDGPDGNIYPINPPKIRRSIGSLVVEGREIVIALGRELRKGTSASKQEIQLLREMLDFVLIEISEHGNREALEAGADILQLIKRVEHKQSLRANNE